MKQYDLPASLAARVADLPPQLSVSQLAAFFQKKTFTLRKQIERGTFPVTIRQIEGGEQHAILADLIRYLENGEPQPQPPIKKRAARNPFGRYGKVGKRGRGRPSHADVAARKLAEQQAGEL
jgi:hypothetical protein